MSRPYRVLKAENRRAYRYDSWTPLALSASQPAPEGYPKDWPEDTVTQKKSGVA